MPSLSPGTAIFTVSVLFPAASAALTSSVMSISFPSASVLTKVISARIVVSFSETATLSKEALSLALAVETTISTVASPIWSSSSSAEMIIEWSSSGISTL